MNSDPWTADDPQPGDFDAVLKTIGPEHVDHRDGDPDAKLRILVSVEGEDAQRLQRIAEARGRARTMSSRSCSETPIARPHSPPR